MKSKILHRRVGGTEKFALRITTVAQLIKTRVKLLACIPPIPPPKDRLLISMTLKRVEINIKFFATMFIKKNLMLFKMLSGKWSWIDTHQLPTPIFLVAGLVFCKVMMTCWISKNLKD